MFVVDGRVNKVKIRNGFREFVKHNSREKLLLFMGHGNLEHPAGKIWLRYFDMAALGTSTPSMYEIQRQAKK